MAASSSNLAEKEVIDLEIPTYAENCESVFSRTDWDSVLRRGDTNPSSAYNGRCAGFHSVIGQCFGNPCTTSKMADTRLSKRSKHTRAIGAKMHACIQHNSYCKRLVPKYDELGANKRTKKRQNARAYNLSKRPDMVCKTCLHPFRCRSNSCFVWGKVFEDWLEMNELIPIAAEFSVAWHKVDASSRIDMLCVDSSTMDQNTQSPSVVVVSIKTLGENEKPPELEHRSCHVALLPFDVFRTPVIDCEYTRNQLQLMLECIALADSYGLVVQNAYVVYVNYSSDQNSRQKPVEYQAADKWWFNTLFKECGVSNLIHRERACAIASHIRTQLSAKIAYSR
jgi:hypothetical protein